MDMTLPGLCAALLETGGTDLHLRVGQEPCIRLRGREQLIDDTIVTRAHLDALIEGVRFAQDRIFDAKWLDFAITHDSHRYRGSFYRGDKPGMILRRIIATNAAA